MILLIDNYDSFSYNLYQLIGMIRPDIRDIRNDEMTIAEIEALAPDHIIVSPGPGRPKDAGICEEVIDYFKGKIPIFGVCLGHQAICETFGGEIGYAKKLMHGKMSIVDLDTDSAIFKGMEPKLQAARISFPRRRGRQASSGAEGNRPHGGWRDHGSGAPELPGIRRTVPPGVNPDPRWKENYGAVFGYEIRRTKR